MYEVEMINLDGTHDRFITDASGKGMFEAYKAFAKKWREERGNLDGLKYVYGPIKFVPHQALRRGV
jgi:hypothetical protein